MSRALLERRLTELSGRLQQARRELAVADEQLAQLSEEAEDARLRSLLSETPLAAQEYREAARHADAMTRHRSAVATTITELERAQDDLLDRLIAAPD